MPVLTLLHLSDIHLLGLDDESIHDSFLELREALEDDVRRLVVEHGRIDAIVIGGDVVAHGKPEQFEAATRWIDRLAAIAGCSHAEVFCVPGNHDIDRGPAQDDGVLALAQEQLRYCPLEEIDSSLKRALLSPVKPEALLAPLRPYNDFAAPFDCPIEPNRLRWKRELPHRLAGRVVHLVGLTSPLVSGPRDARRLEDLADDSRKMVMGTGQAFLHRNDGSIVIAVCHHPLHWLRDEQAIEARLARAQVLLFGHEHALEIEGGGYRPIVVRAGAVQPEHDGKTTPAFNVLRLDTTNDQRLRVRVHARGWIEDDRGFGPMPGIADPTERTVPLPPSGESGARPDEAPEDVPVAAPARRETIWRLMQSPPAVRRKALMDMEVLATDAPSQPADLVPSVRALDRHQRWGELAELLDSL